MTKIKIFENKQKIDLPTFIDSRALICANSGGGKSYAVRKILEESSEKVLSIVLDVEGEFRTLREKYDYLLIGDNGDVPLSMKSAKLLPEKILGLNVSTIIDISDLKRHERIKYVKDFLEGLMQLKKVFWKPCLVVLDEAHLLAGQQEKQDSCSSVIDLMTRGRKRGYCGILCTQRISKLHKDAVAECNNILIGRTGLDIDMKRASEILGFTSKKDMLSLRDLEAGEFYVFGTAISRVVNKQKVAEVKTTHPKVGMDLTTEIIKPTDKIKSILSKVKELPEEQERKLKEVEDYKKEILHLHRELKLLKSSKPKIEFDESKIERAKQIGFKECENNYISITKDYQKTIRLLENKISQIGKILGQEIPKIEINIPQRVGGATGESSKTSTQKENRITSVVTPTKYPTLVDSYSDTKPLRAGAMKMLNWLAGAYPESLTKQRLATLSGFSVKGGTFNTYISELKRNNWIEGNHKLTATEEGIQNSQPQEIPSGEDLLNLWKSKFRDGAGRILSFVFENNEVSKEDIGEATGFEISGGTFNTYLSELRRNNLIEISGNMIKISEEFF